MDAVTGIADLTVSDDVAAVAVATGSETSALPRVVLAYRNHLEVRGLTDGTGTSTGPGA